MAAPTLNDKETRRSLRDKSKLNVHKAKPHLISPYSYAWPVLDELVCKEVIDKISMLFQSLPLRREKTPCKGKQKKSETKIEETEDDKKRKYLRSLMAIGINAVTRGLEKDDLDLVIACRSTEPQLITKHLIPLAACRQCPAMCIPQFSEAIAPQLGMKSLVGIGFKKIASKEDSEFSDFVKYGQTCAIPISMPWDEDTHDVKPLTVPEMVLSSKSGNNIQVKQDQEKPKNPTDLETEKPDSSLQTEDKHLLTVKKGNQENETNDEVKNKEMNQTANIKTDTLETEKSKSSQKSTEQDSQNVLGKNQTVIKTNSVVNKFVPKDDYSYLYIFKSENKKTKDWGEFVSLVDDSDSSDTDTCCYKYIPQLESDESPNLTYLKKRKYPSNQNETSDIPRTFPQLKYRKTKIGHQIKNPNKIKQKKKLKK